MKTQKTQIDVRALAKIGALARIAELETELGDLRRMFSDRELPSVGTDRKPWHIDGKRPAKRTYKLSAAQRHAISVRMQKYWRARRREK